MKRRNLIYWTYLIFYIQITYGQDKTITKMESVQSLFVEVFSEKQNLGSGTGFIIKSKTQNYLITNWHVATLKNASTQTWIDPQMAISPTKIKIYHHSKILGKYTITEERLLTNKGDKLFKEFKIGNQMVDAIAIPLKDSIFNIKMYPVDYKNTPDKILMTPTDRVYIVGFPKGMKSAYEFPIWKSGLIASEPEIDQEGKPIIWIDMMGYGGMSGSPVYLISKNIQTKDGSDRLIIGGSESYFLGIFSHGQPQIGTGALWKATYLKSLFNTLP